MKTVTLSLIAILAACEAPQVASALTEPAPVPESPADEVPAQDPVTEAEPVTEATCEETSTCPADVMTAVEAFQELGLQEQYINFAPYTNRVYSMGHTLSDVDALELRLADGWTDRGEVLLHSANGLHGLYFRANQPGGWNGDIMIVKSSAYVNDSGLIMRGFRWDTSYSASVELCMNDIAFGVQGCKRISVTHEE